VTATLQSFGPQRPRTDFPANPHHTVFQRFMMITAYLFEEKREYISSKSPISNRFMVKRDFQTDDRRL
jgi:hypothetical protein